MNTEPRLHSSYIWEVFMARLQKPHPGIRIDKIPAKGAVGLVFVLGVIAMTLVALPQARWFLALAIPAGVIVALVLYLMRR